MFFKNILILFFFCFALHASDVAYRKEFLKLSQPEIATKAKEYQKKSEELAAKLSVSFNKIKIVMRSQTEAMEIAIQCKKEYERLLALEASQLGSLSSGASLNTQPMHNSTLASAAPISSPISASSGLGTSGNNHFQNEITIDHVVSPTASIPSLVSPD